MELEEKLKDFIYQFTKSIGLVWLVKKLPFLQLKEWVEDRDKIS